jgi:hypothetical protein
MSGLRRGWTVNQEGNTMNSKFIEIALHYEHKSRDYKPVTDLSEFELDTITEMVTLGLLIDLRSDVGYVSALNLPVFRGTPQLNAYVEALRGVKIPVLKWVQPDA